MEVCVLLEGMHHHICPVQRWSPGLRCPLLHIPTQNSRVHLHNDLPCCSEICFFPSSLLIFFLSWNARSTEIWMILSSWHKAFLKLQDLHWGKLVILSWSLLLPWWHRETGKNLPVMQETQVWSLSWGDPLEKGMATHSSIVAWRIPWTEEPGGQQSKELQGVVHDWVT